MRTWLLIGLALFGSLCGSSTAAGQTSGPCVRLSWYTCDPQVVDPQSPSAPVLQKLVVSALGVDGPSLGHETTIRYGVDVQDAWRFDDAGCQTTSRIAFANAPLSKACLAMRGDLAQDLTSVTYDPATRCVALHLQVSYASFVAAPTSRYVLWQVNFDHSRSSPEPTVPGETCGGLLGVMTFDVGACRLLLPEGASQTLSTCAGDYPYLCWPGMCWGDLPVVPASWGRLKELYR
jgi:hypothetical protein